MKKTVTTILSLALALILVSSLGNGVTYADGKRKYKKVKMREVVLLDCKVDKTVSSFDSTDTEIAAELAALPSDSCAFAIAFLLNHGHKIISTVVTEGLDEFFFPTSTVCRTFLKTTTMRVAVDAKAKGDDHDDDD